MTRYVTITLKNRDASIPEIAIAIRKLRQIPVSEAISLAYGLRSNVGWQLPHGEINTKPHPIFEFLVDPYVDPYQKWFADAKFYRELLQKGASGDVESAIAYCKAELAGEIGHGCIG